MFAIIEDGGRQYRVKAGDKLEIDYRADLRDGDSVRFDRILAAGTDSDGKIGQPLIEGAAVEAVVINDELKARKLEIGKFRRRKGYIRHNGHTQRYTQVFVTSVDVPGFQATKSEAPAIKKAAAPAPEAAASPA